MASRRQGAAAGDGARTVAYQLLRAVADRGAYANLALPALIAERRLSTRDAALATELGYGTVRASGTLDLIIGACVDRSMTDVEPAVRCLLELGAYQLLRTRIPAHAAVATTVDLARATGHERSAGFINAILRRVSSEDWDAWIDRLTEGSSLTERLAVRYAHPVWIAEAFADALGGDLAETEAALRADEIRPQTHLVAWPGRIGRGDLLAAAGGIPGPYSPYAVRLDRGDPSRLEAIRQRRAGVQDEGSQLCALALTRAPLTGRDERWLDLCAGPGGKTALLAALGAQYAHLDQDRPAGPSVTANELHPHRAELVRKATLSWAVDIRVGDARALIAPPGGWDRILVDAPCTGLGALRRRPESRWRRSAADVSELAALQRDLLATALALSRPGGVVAYVTCSPHPAETVSILDDLAARSAAGDVCPHELLDARPAFPGVEALGAGPWVQLWPHRHGTDAMFCALIRRV
ncbi:MAG: rRNA small subunit methyltransferase B [Actinomycetota bacterium]|nr:rRNA small subunit methyltransferase B [Actinomycetota bacterium]